MLRKSFSAALFTLALACLALPNLVFAQMETLRIGFLTVRSGPLAAGGRQYAN